MLDEDAKRALLSVRLITGALVVGVALFGVVVAYLVTRPEYQAVAPGDRLLPLAGFLTVASLLSAPFIENTIRRLPGKASVEQALSRFQIAAIVGLGLREAAALFALAVGLLTGQLNWGLGLAGVAVLGMFLAAPGADALATFLRHWTSGERS